MGKNSGAKPGHENPKNGRAVLCMMKTNIHDHQIYSVKLNELRVLVETLGLEITSEFVQTQQHASARFLIGSGKVKELRRYVEENDINIVVFYNILRSSQKLNLIRELRCDVMDRFEVTLEIFDRMSSDNISKIQIEAARLDKLAPYMKLAATVRFQQERPFFLSMGEYAYHRQLRELTRRQAKIREQIEAFMKEKRQQIRKRKSLGYPLVCIAGYYNAGKTSLFNVLTGDSKPVSPLPFTTLSSKYQRRYIDAETSLMFIDTIGFVIDIDPRLIKSFALNLEDIRSADVVLLLLEITDPLLTLRIKLHEGVKILGELGVTREKIIVVFNKVDQAPELATTIDESLDLVRLGLPWTVVSAKDRTNLNGLLGLIMERLRALKTATQGAVEETVVEQG